MSKEYDVVVIGGGPGGYNAAIRAAQLGLKTACFDKRETEKFGGTCLNVGCIPSKAMLHASEAYEHAGSHFADLGVKVEGLSLELDKMLGQKADAVDGLTKGIEFLFKKNGVDGYLGWGKIEGPGKVSVTTKEGAETLSAKNIIIATGSDILSLPGVDIDEEVIVSSTGALSQEEGAGAPRRRGRRLYWLGDGLGLASSGCQGDGGGIPRSHHARYGC